MTLGQVGQLASSRSASHTLAPELRALMAILAGVAGPVISTRRSCRAGGAGGDLPVAVADLRGLGEEVQSTGPGGLAALLAAGGEQLVAGAGEALVQVLDEGQGLRGEDLLGAVDGLGVGEFDAS